MRTNVYVPDAQVAWTGNFTSNQRFTTMLLEGGPREYIDTLARFKNELALRRTYRALSAERGPSS